MKANLRGVMAIAATAALLLGLWQMTEVADAGELDAAHGAALAPPAPGQTVGGLESGAAVDPWWPAPGANWVAGWELTYRPTPKITQFAGAYLCGAVLGMFPSETVEETVRDWLKCSFRWADMFM